MNNAIRLTGTISSVDDRLPALLSDLVAQTRELLASSQRAPEAFEFNFGGRVAVVNMAPMNVESSTQTVASGLSLPMASADLLVLLLTSSDQPQTWQISVGGFPIAHQVLQDRSEWVKTADTDAKAPVDGDWMFSSADSYRLLDPRLGTTMVNSMSAYFLKAVGELTNLVHDIKDPKYLESVRKEFEGRWGDVFQTQEREVPGMDLGKPAEPEPAPLNMGELMGELMERFKRGPAGAKP